VRSLNIELKQLMGWVSLIVRHSVRRRERDQGTQRAIIVNVEGATGDQKLCVLSVNERVQDVAPVTAQVVDLGPTAEDEKSPLGNDWDHWMQSR
jgi:hypothetical protein